MKTGFLIRLKTIKRFLRIFSMSAAIQIVYVLSFYSAYGLDISTIKYSIAQVLCAALVYGVLLSKCDDNVRPTIGFLSTFIATTYVALSSVKYVIKANYVGFISDNNLRLLGTIMITIVLFCVSNHQKMYICIQDTSINRKNTSIKNTKVLAWLIEISFLIICILAAFSSSKTQGDKYITEKLFSTSATLASLIYKFFNYCGIYCSAICWNKGFKSKIPALIAIVVNFYASYSRGSRAAFVVPFLMLVYLLAYLGKMQFKFFIWTSEFAPVMLFVFTYVVFLGSGRSVAARSLVRNLAYRFDFSDFCMTIMENTSYLRFDFSELINGFRMSVPSFIVGSGYKNINSYTGILASASLDPTVDYSDSFFSMGTTQLGIVGFFLLFPVLIAVFNKIENKLMTDVSFGLLYITLFLPIAIQIEIDVIYFIARFRDALLMMLVIYIYKLILRRGVQWRNI